MGETFSTGGSCAQGDLTGAAEEGFATRVGFSGWPLGLAALADALAPGFRIVFVPPVTPDRSVLEDGVGTGAGDGAGDGDGAGTGVGAGADFATAKDASVLGADFTSSGGGGRFSAATVDLVPSIHCTVSGVQSSSSSSISAHFASFPPSSACSRVAR